MPSFSICIATYKRPEGLRALLDSIEAQVLDKDDTVEIIVVDNDPRSSEPVVTDFANSSRFDVVYLEQPEQNISITRNVSVHAASGELIWFVDDDEVAIPDCLALLAKALHDHRADGVFGPVLPTFETPQPTWIEESTVFNRPIKATGTVSAGHRTSNTLVKTELLKSVEGPFDPDFGLSGGSDSMLFRQLEMAGAHFIDSGDAVVHEAVPASRSTWTWMKARTRRQGQNYARQTVMLNGGLRNSTVLWMLAKAAVQVPLALGGIAIRFKDRRQRSEHELRLWSNIGKFEGARGTYTERML